jgi:hypothetical protein
MNEIPNLEINATRIVSIQDGDHENGYRIHIVMFRPSKKTLQRIRELEDCPEITIQLVDETGDWVNDRKVAITDVAISEDGKAGSITAQYA